MTTDALASAATDAPRIDCAQHLGLAWHVANAWARRQKTLERDELVSIASMALVECALVFDPARGVKFSTFALPRLNGAVMDALRSWNRIRRGRVSHVMVSLDVPEAADAPAPSAPNWALIEQAIAQLSADRAHLARRVIYDGATVRDLAADFPQWSALTIRVYRAEVRRAITAFIRESAA